ESVTENAAEEKPDNEHDEKISAEETMDFGQSEILKQKVQQEEKEPQSDRKTVVRSSIRVDAEKIDYLMNQVGELVVSRAYFAQLVNEMRSLEQQLLESSGVSKNQLKPLHEFAFRLSEAGVHLGRVSNELQEGVMKVRMLPIDQLFKRYPRLVRDLIHSTDKDVRLITRGEETELDKMVIESISDPLIHIIRNSVDHGIETVEERLRAGKPAQGSLVLEAFHESDHIVLEITDDGRGIDTQRIKAKALEKHLYTTPPIRSRSFEEVPADILISSWCNWLEPRLWWQTTVAHGEQEELAAADRIAAWIKEKTDMSMDEFFGLFGKNLGIHVADISTAGFFPVPRLCLSIEILNQKKMDEFFRKIIADFPVRHTMTGGVPVVSLLAAQGMLQPSYTFFNGSLLLADSREQIEDILLRKKTPLAEGKKFQAVDTKPAEPANLHLFARIPEVINALQELASWAGTMIAVRDQQAGATSKLLVDQVVSPLLGSFNTYQAIGIRSATAPNQLVIDGKVLRAPPAK
ncbi:MAG: hypothetical protein D3914_13710, partial [Candidatus Electrothrix sp. LOE2]|nr:hypothetical protein [Candidatus Electrothrix sp. LOE2]